MDPGPSSPLTMPGAVNRPHNQSPRPDLVELHPWGEGTGCARIALGIQLSTAEGQSALTVASHLAPQ